MDMFSMPWRSMLKSQALCIMAGANKLVKLVKFVQLLDKQEIGENSLQF